MYKDFFGLQEYPFNMTPDPAFLYFSHNHRIALDLLQHGIRERKGFMVITGEVGAGKTTLCRALLNALDDETKTALVLNPCLSDAQILRAITEEFRLQPKRTTRKDLYDAINAFLLRELAANHNVVLIIDEAQNLKASVLEQIRLLSNLETEKEKLLQIVLVGQPELRTLLSQERLRQLRQRIVLHHHVGPLHAGEVGPYIDHRLHVAGANGRVTWTEEALALVNEHSQRMPRLINLICEAALTAAFITESHIVGRQQIEMALEETSLALNAELEVATR